jgi:hypothetical protein
MKIAASAESMVYWRELSVYPVVEFEQDKCNHLGPFTPLVRVCFGDK